MYKNIPEAFATLASKSKWDFDYTNDSLDPHYFRAPLCRINGDWDPVDTEVYKEKLTTGKITLEQQNFSGLSLQDRYLEGRVEDSSSWVQQVVDVIPFGKSRSLVHIQKPGQMHMLHMDANYGGGFWDYLGDEKDNKIARVMIMLDDWAPGQVMMFGCHHYTKWQKGDVVYFRWQDIPHGTANFGHTNRPLIIVTGEITPEFESLFDNVTTFNISVKNTCIN